MRVVLVNNLYGAWARGGAERIVEREAAALTKRGHSVTVVSSSPTGGKLSTENGIAAHEVRASNLCAYVELGAHEAAFRLSWHVIDTLGPGAIRHVLGIARKTGADVVHTHNLMGLGFRLPRALKAAGIRHVHTVHDVQLLHPSGLLPVTYDGPRTSAERNYIRLMRMVMGSPDVVIYPSEAIRRMHERHGFFRSSDARIIRNPARAVDQDSVRTRSEITSFVFVGQLEPHKGIMKLLKAWQQWQDREGATLTIVGSGSLERDVRALADRIGTSVIVRGRLDAPSVHAALLGASYAVIPSKVIETAPAVLTEAFSEGTPVVAAATGGIPELVIEGETGFLYGADSTDALLDALKRAATWDRWDHLSSSARKRASSLSMDMHVEALISLYHRP